MWAIVLMNERVTREERLQSPGEEIANSVPTGQQLDCCRCVGLRCDDRMAVSRVYGLSRAAAK